jgi:hypothetical protein
MHGTASIKKHFNPFDTFKKNISILAVNKIIIRG